MLLVSIEDAPFFYKGRPSMVRLRNFEDPIYAYLLRLEALCS